MGNLAEFDAVAADLDLFVLAAQVFDSALRILLDAIAGAVHPCAGGEGIGHEAFGSEPGPSKVAAGQLRSGDIELTDNAAWYRVQVGVEHVDARAGQRGAGR